MTELRRLVPAVLALLLAGCSTEDPDVTGAWPGEPGQANAAPGSSNKARTATRVVAPGAREIMAEARKATDLGNFGGAATLYEEVIKLDPTNREALSKLAFVYQERAINLDRPKSSEPFLRSAAVMRQLRAAYPKLSGEEAALLPTVLFNEARTHAVQNEPEKALESLAAAVDAGFIQLKPLNTDAELGPIRKLPRFQEIAKKVETEARALASQAAKLILAEKSFPFTFKFPAVDGRVVSLEDFRDKVVLVDMWGTWCYPCRAAVPHLIELSKTYKDQGFQVVGLNFERVADDEIKSTIAEFVKSSGITYPCLIADPKFTEQVPNFQGFPTTIFLDRKGKVRGVLRGFNSENTVAILMLEEIVKTLLAEKP